MTVSTTQRNIGLALIGTYWFSFIVMSSVEGILANEAAGVRHRVLSIVWDVYRLPPLAILGSLRYVLPYPQFMFLGPPISLAIGLVATCSVWWLWTRSPSHKDRLT